MFNEIDDSTFVLESDLVFLSGSFVLEDNFEIAIKKCDRLKTLNNSACNELDAFGGEYFWIGPKTNRCSRCHL